MQLSPGVKCGSPFLQQLLEQRYCALQGVQRLEGEVPRYVLAWRLSHYITDVRYRFSWWGSCLNIVRMQQRFRWRYSPFVWCPRTPRLSSCLVCSIVTTGSSRSTSNFIGLSISFYTDYVYAGVSANSRKPHSRELVESTGDPGLTMAGNV